jgi:subfamily B ATP-binding cassette protein HlyB/CyaB
MQQRNDLGGQTERIDSGLSALCGIAAYYRVPADPVYLARELALGDAAEVDDVLRAANLIRMRARKVRLRSAERLVAIPTPAIVQLVSGAFAVLGGSAQPGYFRLVDPILRRDREVSLDELFESIQPFVILVARRVIGPGMTPRAFSMRWFFPSIWRYRNPLAHVLATSVLLQIFALITPLFFQIIIDKVLVHKGMDTLYMLIFGLIAVAGFEVAVQYLRTYTLSHTTNRIDVELGRRLFHHLLNLPLQFFESIPAGQTVARIRELDNIRNFLTGQALFSMLDFVFAFILIGVLFVYSAQLTLIVLLTIPFYILVALLIRPHLREQIKEKFNRGAESQQFLVETVVGIQTIKAAAVEPPTRMQWEERLAAYVRSSFNAGLTAAAGQGAIQAISKLSTALFLLFGAQAVINGSLTVGELIAFNMIAAQATAPVMRLSQLWQDFQQVQVSVDRLGDILNRPTEATSAGAAMGALPRPVGQIQISNVGFRYRSDGPEILKNVSLDIRAGEVIGIVGPSGSGKSTLTKLVQRLYIASEGQVLIDGLDVTHVDPAWLRSHIGVVLQENLLFNRSVHDNIALANPAAPRASVIAVARLAGADGFIARMPQGYDTIIEERGTNLSGGQRQRIAIARALITNPPIIIFDEATSALDYESERIIQQNMSRIVKNRTVIIIAHRLAAVRGCDRIVGMDDGRIVEIGSHDELIARPDGLYARLWQLQMGMVDA